MARPDKVAVVDRVTEQLNDAAATLLTDYRGLSVTELAELRAELRKVDASYHVVKNTLTRLAARQAGMEGLDDFLTGPTALVLCGEDPVGPAKTLKRFAEEHEALSLKGGYLDGEVLDADAAIGLADLASREELLATFAGMLDNALAGFARLMQAPIVEMARLAAALEDDGGVEAKGFTPEAPAATASASDEDEPEDVAADAEDEPEDVAAAAEDASSASSDSSDSDDSDDSDDSADEPAPAADESSEPATIAEADAVEETEAHDDLRATATAVDDAAAAEVDTDAAEADTDAADTDAAEADADTED